MSNTATFPSHLYELLFAGVEVPHAVEVHRRADRLLEEHLHAVPLEDVDPARERTAKR